MKNITGKICRTILLLAAAACCYLLAAHHYAQAQSSVGVVTAKLEGTALSAREAQEICAREQEQETPLYLCFWGERQELQLFCRETGGRAQAGALYVEGSPELVIPGTGLLSWNEGGCFADTQTAQSLFGMSQAVGQTLWCGEQSYRICGTFESLNRLIVLPAGQAPEPVLDMVSVMKAETARGSAEWSVTGRGSAVPSVTAAGKVREDAEQLLLRYGLTGDSMDFLFFGAFAGDLLLLLPALLCVSILRVLWRCRRETEKILQKTVFLLLFLGLAVIFWRLFAALVQIPGDMIPARWSDFSFWPQWWNGQKQNLLRILGGAQGEMQLEMLWNLLLSCFWSLLSVAAGAGLVF